MLAEAKNELPAIHLKGLVKLVDAVKEAYTSVEEKHGWSKEPVENAATFEDGQYIQAVVDTARQSSVAHEWLPIKLMSEEPDPNPSLSEAYRRSTLNIS